MKLAANNTSKHAGPRQSVSALTFELSGAGSEIHLLPDGEFQTDDFRTDVYKLNAVIAARVIERANARQRDTVIDYEHHTLMADFAGTKAIAAGWFHNLDYRPGQGLFITDARWTAAAKQHIESGEYRYISAVFTYDDDTGEIIRVLHAGLTNDPALDGLKELELRAAAKFNLNPTQDEDTPMNEELLTLLGLKEGASEEDAIAALKAVQAQLNGKAQEVAALKRAAEKSADPDPSKFVSVDVVEELKTEVAALRAENIENQVTDLVGVALSEGRILPAQENWARELGKKDVAALKTYLETSQPIAALKGSQTGGNGPAGPEGGDAELTAGELAICKAMGMSKETFLEARKAEAAQAQA